MQWPRIEGGLRAIGKIELVVVNGDRDLSRVWRTMMKEHHPLSDGPLLDQQVSVPECPLHCTNDARRCPQGSTWPLKGLGLLGTRLFELRLKLLGASPSPI